MTPPTGSGLLSGRSMPPGPMTPAGDRKGRPYADISVTRLRAHMRKPPTFRWAAHVIRYFRFFSRSSTTSAAPDTAMTATATMIISPVKGLPLSVTIRKEPMPVAPSV